MLTRILLTYKNKLLDSSHSISSNINFLYFYKRYLEKLTIKVVHWQCERECGTLITNGGISISLILDKFYKFLKLRNLEGAHRIAWYEQQNFPT